MIFLLTIEGVIIEDTLKTWLKIYSSETVRKNYFPPDNNLESDWLVFGIEDPLWVADSSPSDPFDCVYLISCLLVWAVFFFEAR